MAVPSRAGRSGPALALMIGVVVLWLTVLALILRAAALGPDDAGKVFVIFPPGTGEAQAFAAIVGAGGAPIRPALGQWAWIAHGDSAGFVGRLEASGALAAFRGAPAGLSLAGCFGLAADPEIPTTPLRARLPPAPPRAAPERFAALGWHCQDGIDHLSSGELAAPGRLSGQSPTCLR